MREREEEKRDREGWRRGRGRVGWKKNTRDRIETRWDGRCHDDQLSFSPPCTPKKGVAPPPLHLTPPLVHRYGFFSVGFHSRATRRRPNFFLSEERISLSLPLSSRSTSVPSVECAQRRPFVAGFSPPFCRCGWLARRRHCRRPSPLLVVATPAAAPPRVPDFKGFQLLGSRSFDHGAKIVIQDES